jgi:hypothetical protein
VKTLREGFGDLLSATRNQEFLQTPLSGERLEGLKNHLGRDVTDRIPGLASSDGKTLKELLSKNPGIATEYPQVLTYLAAVRRQEGVKMFSDDRTVDPVTISNPARVVPTGDLSRFGSGGDSEDRFRDYLKSNFGLDDGQVKAYGAFLKLGTGGTGATDATDPGPGVFSQLLARASGGRGGGGLYLPSREVLNNLAQVMAFGQEFVKNADADPSSFKGPDGRTLGDLLAEFEPDPNKRKTVDDLKKMSTSDVRSQILALMDQMTRRDLDGPNRVLLDMGVAWLAPAGDGPAAGGGSNLRGKKKRGGVLGNGKIREMNEALYKALILDELTGVQRDQIELESEGEFFSLRGKPSDIHQKHYDPPVDPDGLLFGTGMSLDNHR